MDQNALVYTHKCVFLAEEHNVTTTKWRPQGC